MIILLSPPTYTTQRKSLSPTLFNLFGKNGGVGPFLCDWVPEAVTLLWLWHVYRQEHWRYKSRLCPRWFKWWNIWFIRGSWIIIRSVIFIEVSRFLKRPHQNGVLYVVVQLSKKTEEVEGLTSFFDVVIFENVALKVIIFLFKNMISTLQVSFREQNLRMKQFNFLVCFRKHF